MNPVHTWTLIKGIENSFLFGFRIWDGRIKYAAATIVFATILLLTFGSVSVLDNVLAVAMRTVLGGLSTDHNAIDFTLSFEI